MNDFLKQWESRLSPEQIERLDRIFAPISVGVPLSDTRRDMCFLPDGEIRSYGTSPYGKQTSKMEYLSSRDGGLSWAIYPARGTMHSCSYFPKENIFMTIRETERGVFILRSVYGPDDPSPEQIMVSDLKCRNGFQPLQSSYGRRIWFTSECGNTPVFFFSDDCGETWNERTIPASWRFDIIFPHKGLRWCKNSGCEPYAAETAPGKMMMLLRTPTDCFWQCESVDGGNTWSDPHPSIFYGTDTTACLLHMSDGRTVAFWNNTKPLSQPNYAGLTPFPGQDVIDGTGENAFTNRDAAHAAISCDGGTTFIGRREILLNPSRNRSDFRYFGNPSSDKSVHQFQALELPRGKILVSAGQNRASRRLVMFDPEWLLETNRREDFLEGLEGITTHTYLKSISGSHYLQIGNGHCAWNRADNSFPVPDPDGGYGEVLLVRKQHDERRINDIGGAVWNFPASSSGSVTIEIKILEKQALLILTDRWYNTCDPYATLMSPFWFELDAKDTGTDFCKVRISYSTEKGFAEVSINEKPFFKVRQTVPCPAGVSYLILQCASDGDSRGFCVRCIEKT